VSTSAASLCGGGRRPDGEHSIASATSATERIGARRSTRRDAAQSASRWRSREVGAGQPSAAVRPDPFDRDIDRVWNGGENVPQLVRRADQPERQPAARSVHDRRHREELRVDERIEKRLQRPAEPLVRLEVEGVVAGSRLEAVDRVDGSQAFEVPLSGATTRNSVTSVSSGSRRHVNSSVRHPSPSSRKSCIGCRTDGGNANSTRTYRIRLVASSHHLKVKTHGLIRAKAQRRTGPIDTYVQPDHPLRRRSSATVRR